MTSAYQLFIWTIHRMYPQDQWDERLPGWERPSSKLLKELEKQMQSVNRDYIYNITPTQYSEAIDFVTSGTLPQGKSNSATYRFKCRWSDAEVRFIDGEPRLFMDDREVISTNRIQDVLSKL